MAPFRFSEADLWPGCREITLEGELDLAVGGELQVALDGAVARHDHMLIDLTACEFIDVRSLAALVRAHERLRHRDRQLLLLGARGQARRLLSVTGLIESELCLAAAKRPPYRHRAVAAPVR
jgi:anti-anti-sigma factor